MDLNIRRINLLGGPGSGKSTMAAELYSRFKRKGESVELVREYVKEWAYEGRTIEPYDQVYFFAKQMRKEMVVLNAGVSFIITDSPLLLQIMYGKRSGLDEQTVRGMVEIYSAYERAYPSLGIALNRRDKLYIGEGRYENKQKAIEVDKLIADVLAEWGISCLEYDWNQYNDVYERVKEAINNE